MPDASVSLALEADSFDRDLARSERNLTGAQNRMTAGSQRLGGAQDRLLESNNRVTNQIAGFSRTLLSARGATDILAAGFDRLENSTNLSLGMGAMLAVTGVAISQIAQLRAEFKKTQAESEKLLTASSGASEFDSLSRLEKHLGNIREKLTLLRTEAKGGLVQNIIDAFGENFFTENGELLPDSGKADRRRKKEIAKYEDRERENQKAASLNRYGKLDDRQAALDGEPEYVTKAKKLSREAFEHASEGLDALVQAMAEMEMSFKELAASVSARRRERVSQSLGELAAIPSSIEAIGPHGISLDRWQTGEKARGAQQWESYAEQLRMSGDQVGAQDAFNYATDIKRSIPGLRDSEKDLKSEFTGALDASTVLKEIRNNTAKPLTNR